MIQATRPAIQLDNVTHTFALNSSSPVTAVRDINIDIEVGRFVSIIGQSGCGKSTLFNIIAGLLCPTTGQVIYEGKDITGRAGIVSYMLQKDLLLPWRTVIDNVILGMELRGVPKAKARPLAEDLLKRYGLGGFETNYPASLSGGMRQRAALLRTLLCDSDVILLDEPFGALDAQTRLSMQQWLLDLWQDFGKTILFVTHDVDEAVYLSDEIYVLSARPGKVKDHFSVNLARPRDRQIFASSEFLELKQHCLSLLFDKSDNAGELSGSGG